MAVNKKEDNLNRDGAYFIGMKGDKVQVITSVGNKRESLPVYGINGRTREALGK